LQTKGHAAPLVQKPFAPHDSGIVPVQRVLPGEHSPVHVPALQTNGHAVSIPQVPDVQVCVLVPEHCAAPSVQATVVQAPSEHRTVQAAALLQVAVESHVRGTFPRHSTLVGTHSPVQVPVAWLHA
jgi:hypothetical protein